MCGQASQGQRVYLLLIFIDVGERSHKQAECSRRRASSEGEGSRSVAAGGAPSAAKTSSAVLTSINPGRESVRAATSSRGPGSSGNGWIN